MAKHQQHEGPDRGKQAQFDFALSSSWVPSAVRYARPKLVHGVIPADCIRVADNLLSITGDGAATRIELKLGRMPQERELTLESPYPEMYGVTRYLLAKAASPDTAARELGISAPLSMVITSLMKRVDYLIPQGMTDAILITDLKSLSEHSRESIANAYRTLFRQVSSFLGWQNQLFPDSGESSTAPDPHRVAKFERRQQLEAMNSNQLFVEFENCYDKHPYFRLNASKASDAQKYFIEGARALMAFGRTFGDSLPRNGEFSQEQINILLRKGIEVMDFIVREHKLSAD